MNGIVMKRLALSACAGVLIGASLSACVPLLVGGAAAGGSVLIAVLNPNLLLTSLDFTVI